LNDKDDVLDIGCGNAGLWKDLLKSNPTLSSLTLSDISTGMLEKAKETMDSEAVSYKINYKEFDAVAIPYPDMTFDVVIANHVLYHVSDVDSAISEIARVLKPSGRFYASTIGKHHMQEIAEIVREFLPEMQYDSMIVAERFGLENGVEKLKKFFEITERVDYKDYLLIPEVEPIIEYISSMDSEGILEKSEVIDHLKAGIFSKNDFSNGYTITKATGIVIGIKSK
jgi:ubiquinone/menaquinone biosynthesis C-methylase UbiE